jgi:two-component system response regulator AtoC
MMFPRRLRAVEEKRQSGLFRHSLDELQNIYDSKNLLDRVLMAELLLRTESSGRAQTIARQILEASQVPVAVQARAGIVLGLALVRVNQIGDAVRSFERAVHLASKADDHELLCWGQTELLVAKFDLFGPASLGTLPADAWRNVQSSGDPNLFALLHCRLAALEALRGAVDIARRHADLAMSRSKGTDNPYIGCLTCNLSANLAVLAADPREAIAYAKQSLELARRAGDHFNEVGALANLCHMSILVGALDEAERYLALVEPLVNNNLLVRLTLLDHRAQLQLLAGDLDGCERSVTALTSLCNGADLASRSYTALEATSTHIRLLQRQGRPEEAVALARTAAAAACTRGATPLEARFSLQCADLLVDLKHVDAAARALGEAVEAASGLSVDALAIHAEVQRVRGTVLCELGAREAAIRHFDRAIRMNAAISHAIAQTHAVETKVRLIDQRNSDTRREDCTDTSPTTQQAVGSPWPDLHGLESAASLLVVASRPDLLGLEAFELLASSGLIGHMALVTKGDSSPRTLKEHKWSEAKMPEIPNTTSIPLGKMGQQEFVLQVTPAADLSSQSCVAAIGALLQATVAGEEARRERLERNSVTPVGNYGDHEGPLFSSPRMRDVYRQAAKVAGSDMTILLTGETGVGKEVLAREIHRLSPQARGAFQPLVCAGVPSGVLDSQLFGYQKGSFTGAVVDFQGVIRGASGGTLFLDEIGELATELQVKLLRFLDSKEVHPLGELRSFNVDVRIIAATNADVQQLVDDRKFREDLFYRLNVATFNIPPLRERREEIPSLVRHFLVQYCQRNHKVMPTLSDEAAEYLLLYRWPGNVRELRNEMERLAGTVDAGATIRPSDLKSQIVSGRRTQPIISGPNEVVIRTDQSLADAIEQLEREMIKRALNGRPGRLDDAARTLGITRKGLYSKRERLGLP